MVSRSYLRRVAQSLTPADPALFVPHQAMAPDPMDRRAGAHASPPRATTPRTAEPPGILRRKRASTGDAAGPGAIVSRVAPPDMGQAEAAAGSVVPPSLPATANPVQPSHDRQAETAANLLPQQRDADVLRPTHRTAPAATMPGTTPETVPPLVMTPDNGPSLPPASPFTTTNATPKLQQLPGTNSVSRYVSEQAPPYGLLPPTAPTPTPTPPMTQSPRIHIGTIEIRQTTPPAPPPATPAPTATVLPRPAPTPSTASPPPGYGWRFGLLQS